MEQKKKTIIWETNTEPPKNYFWVKEDGKVYEFDPTEHTWVESKEIQLYQEPTPEPTPEPEPEFTPTEYSFISYGDAEGTTEWAVGKVETTGNTKEFNSEEYTEVKVTENSVEGFVDQTFYVISSAVPGTIYQLYNAEGEAQNIWIKIIDTQPA